MAVFGLFATFTESSKFRTIFGKGMTIILRCDIVISQGGAVMKILKERILRDGVVKEGDVLKVDSFLNHQMDMALIDQIAEELAPLISR